MRTASPICGSIRRRPSPDARPRRASLGLASLGLALALTGVARAQAPAPEETQTCVDVQVGGERSYACINAALARTARLAHTPVNPGILSATSPSNTVGAFNRAGTAERMGDTFGHSVLEQRPPPLVFVNPLFARPPR
jgi:hypothetical protein